MQRRIEKVQVEKLGQKEKYSCWALPLSRCGFDFFRAKSKPKLTKKDEISIKHRHKIKCFSGTIYVFFITCRDLRHRTKFRHTGNDYI